MKIRHLILIAFLIFSYAVNAQQADRWANLMLLVGSWSGEGSGMAGEGTDIFSFTFDLEQKILIRKSQADYGTNSLKDRNITEELMIIYLVDQIPSRAICFNNQGYTVNYSIEYSDKSIIFTSDKIPQTPMFRLSYIFIDSSTVKVIFEISRDGTNFSPFVESINKRV